MNTLYVTKLSKLKRDKKNSCIYSIHTSTVPTQSLVLYIQHRKVNYGQPFEQRISIFLSWMLQLDLMMIIHELTL